MRHDLDRDARKIRDNGLKFLRDVFGIGDIGDNEPCHMGEGRDRLSEVTAGRFLEVKQDGQIVSAAQFFSEGIKDRLPLRREATQDQDRFLSNGTNDLTDSRFVQQQINKLGNLKVVYGDNRFIVPSDD